MQLTAIGLATALALTSTTAFAMGGGGAGASAGVGSSYTSNPAECGGLVCFAKSPSALTRPNPRHKRLRGVGRKDSSLGWLAGGYPGRSLPVKGSTLPR
jgi:hypothetical protein